MGSVEAHVAVPGLLMVCLALLMTCPDGGRVRRISTKVRLDLHQSSSRWRLISPLPPSALGSTALSEIDLTGALALKALIEDARCAGLHVDVDGTPHHSSRILTRVITD